MTHKKATGPLIGTSEPGGNGNGNGQNVNRDAMKDYSRQPALLSIPLLQEWPDCDALADLIVSEIQLSQPNPPGDAYFRFFSAWGRYWGIGEAASV